MPPARTGPSPFGSRALRRAMAGVLISLLAALTPVLSAAPAGAAGLTGRTAAASAAAATTSSSTGESRRDLRPVAHRSGAAASRRQVDDARALPQAHRQRGGPAHQPTCPATGSADPTGPPSSYDVATLRLRTHPLGASHHSAAAGRAPPFSCGS